MWKKKTSNIVKLISIFITLFVILSTLFYQLHIYKKVEKENKVVDGVVYYNNEKKQNLFGYWEFYYNDLIVTDNIDRNPDRYIKVPSLWYLNESGGYDSYGVASYKCTLKNVPKDKFIAIGFDNLSVGYRIFVSNILVAQTGDIIKEDLSFKDLIFIKNYGDQITYAYYTNEVENASLDIVIEVFSINKGGLYKIPTIFYDRSNVNFLNNKITQKSIILGMLILALLMHSLFIIINKNIKSQIIPLIIECLFILYSLLSGVFYASFARSYGFINAEYIDIIVVFINLLIVTLITIKIQDKRNKYRNFIGTTLIVISYVIYAAYALLRKIIVIEDNILLCSLLGIRTFLNAIAFTFLLKDEKNDPAVFFVKLSIISLNITEFFKIMNESGMIYFDTRNSETIFIVLTITFSMISYFIIQSRYQKAGKRNNELLVSNTNYKINLLLNQIKPHFLYNTLNSINSLCMINPDEASKAIVLFSNYLRNNMDSISETNLISISKELEHVKTYVGIEKMRFRDRLNVIINAESKDFLVPPLTIQAITENAIKHGLNSKIDGVTVTIKTFSDDLYNYISIKDNGSGFTINDIALSDSVGLSNIVKRIEMLCTGEIEMTSDIKAGTEIIIKLNKSQK